MLFVKVQRRPGVAAATDHRITTSICDQASITRMRRSLPHVYRACGMRESKRRRTMTMSGGAPSVKRSLSFARDASKEQQRSTCCV
jgi:hypothetical protein